jgi:hypothetical protein
MHTEEDQGFESNRALIKNLGRDVSPIRKENIDGRNKPYVSIDFSSHKNLNNLH